MEYLVMECTLHHAVVLDEEGQWYWFSFVSWSGEEYRWINVAPMRQAFLDGYTRLA